VWNILTSPELPTLINKKRRSSRDESDERCFMVQGNDSLEVYSDTQLDVSTSSHCNDCMDAQALNEELDKICKNLISKYKLLKKDNFCLKEENKNLSSRLEIALQERDEISSELDSLKSQLELALNENKILKTKNDCENVLKKNEALSSKVDFVVKENDSLKNKIDLISKELKDYLNENKTLKNDLDSLVCHASIVSPPSVSIACTTSSIIKNDICMLKKSVDCLGSTLSHCAMNHTRLESMFRKK